MLRNHLFFSALWFHFGFEKINALFNAVLSHQKLSIIPLSCKTKNKDGGSFQKSSPLHALSTEKIYWLTCKNNTGKARRASWLPPFQTQRIKKKWFKHQYRISSEKIENQTSCISVLFSFSSFSKSVACALNHELTWPDEFFPPKVFNGWSYPNCPVKTLILWSVCYWLR